jgi:putative membrane protein
MRLAHLLVAAFVVTATSAVCLITANKVLGDINDQSNMSAGDRQKMQEDFFRMAASGNALQIRLSKLAQEKATDPQVKQIAQTIQSDHEQANQLLKQVADQNHIDVSPDSLNEIDSAKWNALKKKDGEEFTRAYVFSMVGDHARDQLVYAYHANREQGTPAQQYASQVLPKIQMHLRELEQIGRPMAGLGNEAEPAAMRTPPEQQGQQQQEQPQQQHQQPQQQPEQQPQAQPAR